MKHLLFSLVFLATYSFGQISFQETYGGPEVDIGHSVQQTTDGGYIALGQTSSFGNGYQNLYLVKTDEFGVETWSQTYGESDFNWGISVKQTSDGGYILCGGWGSSSLATDSLVLIKTDDLGIEEWNYRFSGTIDRDAGQSVIETADGGFMAVGFTTSFPMEDVFILKTTSAGIEEWNRVYSGSGQEIARVVRQTSDLGYFVFGSTSSYGNGLRDFYLLRLNPSGDSLWTKTYGTSVDEIGTSMHINTDGSIIMIGHEYFNGGNIYVVKADQSGNVIWDNYYGDAGWDLGYSIKETSDGGYVFSGRKDNTISGGTHDMYCVKTNQLGAITWEYSYPLGIQSDATSIQQTTDGGYIMVGNNTTSNGTSFDADMLLVKIPGSGILKIDLLLDPSIEISAYPNPFIDYTVLQVNDEQKRQFNLTIYSSKGDVVFTEENISEGQIRLDRTNFSTGLHFFEISIDNEIIGTGKLIVQ